MKHTTLRGLRRTITAAAALAALVFGTKVAADEVTAPVEVDPFVVVAMDAVEVEAIGDVEVTNSTSTTIVDGVEDVVTTIDYAPVFADAPVEVDSYLPLEEEPTVPATEMEIPVVVDGVEETPVTPETPVEAPVEVDPILPIEEEPVVDPSEEPKHDLPAIEIPVIEEPSVPSVPATISSEEPVVPTTPAPATLTSSVAVRIPFTGATLPKTGEASSLIAVLGFVVLAASAFVASRKRA